MALTTQDFTTGVDFTGVNPVTGADLNSGHTLAAPVDDGAGLGRGIVVATIDSALNTPVVPNANVTTKWKRYLWRRVPHASATDQSPFLYAWSDNAGSVATFLKWIQITLDADTIQQIVDNTAAITELQNVNRDDSYVVSINGGASVVGENIRTWDYVVNNNRAILSYLGAGILKSSVTGDFLVSGYAACWKFNHLAIFSRVDVPAPLIIGNTVYSNAADLNTYSQFHQVITLTTNGTYKLASWIDTANADGRGKDFGTGLFAAVNPVFAQVNFKRLS